MNFTPLSTTPLTPLTPSQPSNTSSSQTLIYKNHQSTIGTFHPEDIKLIQQCLKNKIEEQMTRERMESLSTTDLKTKYDSLITDLRLLEFKTISTKSSLKELLDHTKTSLQLVLNQANGIFYPDSFLIYKFQQVQTEAINVVNKIEMAYKSCKTGGDNDPDLIQDILETNADAISYLNRAIHELQKELSVVSANMSRQNW
ncbi:Uncharacterized protein QTN25_008147 [Entamoeba marina]